MDGGCVTTVSYRGQYNTGNAPDQRFVNFLSSVRRFEDLVMAQPLQQLT